VVVRCLALPMIEQLEHRRLLSVATPVRNHRADRVGPAGSQPGVWVQPGGFHNSHRKTIVGNGAGQTIAIVAAYNDPTIASDLREFDSQFGLPNKAAKGGFALTIAMPQGRPAVDASWAQETALDVEWAHAMAPGARIVLVEVKTDSPADLFKVSTTPESGRRDGRVHELGWDNGPTGVDYQDILTTPAHHIGGLGRGDGVTFVEAASDDGVPNAFPGPSVNVVSVGGTTLTTDPSGNYINETPCPPALLRPPSLMTPTPTPASRLRQCSRRRRRARLANRRRHQRRRPAMGGPLRDRRPGTCDPGQTFPRYRHPDLPTWLPSRQRFPPHPERRRRNGPRESIANKLIDDLADE